MSDHIKLIDPNKPFTLFNYTHWLIGYTKARREFIPDKKRAEYWQFCGRALHDTSVLLNLERWREFMKKFANEVARLEFVDVWFLDGSENYLSFPIDQIVRHENLFLKTLCEFCESLIKKGE